MDRMVQLELELISNIMGLPTLGAQPEEYLDNKARKKDITELVKSQFGTNRGNTRGIVLRDINENVTRFTNNIMDFKLPRKCTK
jgi:hypothetical protein